MCVIGFLWLRPRLLDDSLGFEPVDVELSPVVDEALRKKLISGEPLPALDEALEARLMRHLTSGELRNYLLALAFVEKLLSEDVVLASDAFTQDFLRDGYYRALRHEVHRLALTLERNPRAPLIDPFYPPGATALSRRLHDAQDWAAREFQFMRNRTLNQYWDAVETFSSGDSPHLPVNTDFSSFGWGNYHGEYVLALRMPRSQNTTRKIDRIAAMVTSNNPPR